MKKATASFNIGTGSFMVVLDYDKRDSDFLVADYDDVGMKSVDYQIFQSDFHSVAHIAIKHDDTRADYLKFEAAVNALIDDYCGIVGC